MNISVTIVTPAESYNMPSDEIQRRADEMVRILRSDASGRFHDAVLRGLLKEGRYDEDITVEGLKHNLRI